MGCCFSVKAVIPDGYDENSTSLTTFTRRWQVTPSADEARRKYLADGTIPAVASELDVELRELLGDPISSHYIRNHFESLNVVEVFNCWMDIFEYNSLSTDKGMHSKAGQIYIKYFGSPDTAEEIYKSIFTDDFKKIYENSANDDISNRVYTDRYFHELQLSCFVFMSEKFIEFKNSNKYLELMKILKRKYNRVKANDFEYVKCLGEGGFGVVVHVRKKSTNTNYAMKIQTKEGLYAGAFESPWRIDFEKQAFAASKHPFIIELEYAFHSRSLTYLVMELGDACDLSQSLKACPDNKMDYERVRFYAAEISCVLAYIHQKGLIYRDLKPSNILLNADGHIKLVDFGAVVDVHGKTLTICDQDHYSSPLFSRKRDAGSGNSPIEPRLSATISIDGSANNVDGFSANMDMISANLEDIESVSQSLTPQDTQVEYPDKLNVGSATIDARGIASSKIPELEVPEQASEKLDRAMSVIGTMGFMAPEMVVMMVQTVDSDKVGYTQAVDWWSLGVTIFKLLTGELPFKNELLNNDVNAMAELSSTIRDEYQNLINYAKLFEEIDFGEFQNDVHGDMTSFIRSLLDVDEKRRLGSGSHGHVNVKNHAVFKGIDWPAMNRKEETPPYKPTHVKALDDSPQYRSLEHMMNKLGKAEWLKPKRSLAPIQQYFDHWDYSSAKAKINESKLMLLPTQNDTPA